MTQPGTHKLTEALKGQMPAPAAETADHAGPPEPRGHGSSPAEVAEEARRQHEAQHPGESRDDRLTQMGRADQTHG